MVKVLDPKKTELRILYLYPFNINIHSTFYHPCVANIRAYVFSGCYHCLNLICLYSMHIPTIRQVRFKVFISEVGTRCYFFTLAGGKRMLLALGGVAK